MFSYFSDQMTIKTQMYPIKLRALSISNLHKVTSNSTTIMGVFPKYGRLT